MTEVTRKLEILRAAMAELGTYALRLRGVDWFSWATGGGSSVVIFTSETGVAEVLITQEQALILTTVIEGSRLKAEEAPENFEVLAFPWEDPGAAENFVRQNIPFSREIYSDRPQGVEKALPLSFQYLKMILSPEEIARYRRIGRLASEAMTEAILQAEPSWSENQLAGEGARSLWRRGLDPALIMVSGERRSALYRHPVAGEDRLGGFAMMVFCARASGLYANLTRFVFFRPPTDAEQRRFECVTAIEAVAFKNSTAGRPLAEVYHALAEAYRERGFGEEIHRHHQGGPTGYLSREWVASSACPEDWRLSAGMALAWNPSLPGAKIEDTVLLTERGLEVLTQDPRWPSFQFEGRPRPELGMKV